MFEVQDLRYATLATVSRCGMVWFSEDVLSTDMIFDHYLQLLRQVPLEESEDDVKYAVPTIGSSGDTTEEQASSILLVSCCKVNCALFMHFFFFSNLFV